MQIAPETEMMHELTPEELKALQALLAAGCIISPGVPGQTGAVRQLVEAVYGDDAEARVPAALQQASKKPFQMMRLPILAGTLMCPIIQETIRVLLAQAV